MPAGLLSPHVAAQYPGGPAPGWHPVKPDGTLGNDPLNTSSLFNAYDWTRLDITSSSSLNGQAYGPVTEKYTSGQTQGSVGGVGPHLGDFSDHKITGASTIKFQWVPPNNAAGQPDWANFPAPPLFVLGSINCAGQVSGPAGMEGNGHLADGWGWSDSMTLTGSVPAATHRKVLPASGSRATLSLSPSGDIHVKVVGPNQVGGGEVVLTEYVYPITLSAPNPLTNPLLGDGTNQFVYDRHYPNGILAVPASANVLGAGADDMTWMLPHLTLPLTPTVANIVTNTLTISGSSVVISTPGKYPDPDTTTSYPAASYIAKGLPAANSGFGNHAVTLTVDSKASQFANCQLFYTGSTSNWPGSIGTVQNWYDYYHPYYPLAAFTTGYDPSGYRPQFLAYTNYYPNASGQYTIYMEDATGGGDLEVPIFDINPVADATLHRNLVRWIGTLRIKGIHRYIWIAAHERGHQKILLRTPQDIYTTAVQDASGNYQWPTTSPDGDHVLDAWESTHHLKATSPDTTLAYSNQKFEPEPGDDEVLADVQALKPLMDNRDLWKLDWADFGVQYAGGSKLYWIAKPATTAGFYWKFTPKVVGSPAAGAQPFQVGSTAGPFGDGTYPIQTLKDLTDQYPSLLTDLPPQE